MRGPPRNPGEAVLTQSKLVERLRSLSRPLLWLALCVAVLATGAIGWLSYCEYRNSREVPPPTEVELRQHLGRAVGWIFANISDVSTENNPMLWLFIRDAARLTDDTRLMAAADEYQSHYLKGTLSRFFFDPDGSEQLAGQHIEFPAYWADYQRLFVYGATCNNSVREDPGVLALLRPSGCDPQLMWLRSPWCHTHQLMGLRFVQKNHCESDVETVQFVNTVQNSILAELDAQRSDGGWDGVDVVGHLPGNRVLVWEGGRLYPSIRTQPESNLHATAQGLYLLALLVNAGQ